MTTWTIARHSFKEAIRKRILLVSVIFALALVVSAPFWPAMNDADRLKLVEEISLTAMTFLGIIIAVFVSAYSLPSDIEEKRIYTLATKPVYRHQMLLGKFFGFLLVFGLIILVMGVLSTVLIRGVSTYSRVEVTAPEAPLLVNGSQVGAAGKGRVLRVLAGHADRYDVALPDDLAIQEGAISAAAATVDKATGQVTVRPEGAEVMHNKVPIARVKGGRSLRLKEIAGDSFIVALPEDLRVTAAQVPASATSPPRTIGAVAKRIASPVDKEYHNEGKAAVAEGKLLLYVGNTSIGEIWHFRTPDASTFPAGTPVTVALKVAGVYGQPEGGMTPGGVSRGSINKFGAEVRVMNLRTRRQAMAATQALWITNHYALSFTVPREIVDGGDLAAAITTTAPAFHDDSADYFAQTRTCAWHFRGLKDRRFPEGRITGELGLDLRFRDFPAHGGQVAAVTLRVVNTASGKSEAVAVPVRNGSSVAFSFGRELLGKDGSVDVILESVQEPFVVGVPADGSGIALIERPAAFEWSYAKTILLVFCQLMLVCAATVSASTFLSGGVAALAGFFAYFCGLLVEFMQGILKDPQALSAGHGHGSEQVSQAAQSSFHAAQALLKVFVSVVPDVNKLDTRAFIIAGVDVPAWSVWSGVGTTLLYSLVFLLMAYMVFRRKEFG